MSLTPAERQSLLLSAACQAAFATRTLCEATRVIDLGWKDTANQVHAPLLVAAKNAIEAEGKMDDATARVYAAIVTYLEERDQ